MTRLSEMLKNAKTEEDVKDAYIRALGLKAGSYSKNQVDIKTDEIWFEAKATDTWTPEIFAQLLWYVHNAVIQGQNLPSFLSTINRSIASLGRTKDFQSIYLDNSIDWGKNATSFSKNKVIVEKLAKHIERYTTEYTIGGDIFSQNDADEKAFISAVKNAIESHNSDDSVLLKTPINKNNILFFYLRWKNMIGDHLVNVKDNEDIVDIFYTDLFSDGVNNYHKLLKYNLAILDGKPIFTDQKTVLISVGNINDYSKFWRIYDRPPKEEYWEFITHRRDILLESELKKFRGVFYTPEPVVNLAYEYLNLTLGDDWQEKYFVWDMCCGQGNLFYQHHHTHDNLFLSTLEQSDIRSMQESGYCVRAHKFQYDYLNDDIATDGTIDYKLTNKIPDSLIKALQSGKPFLVFINPPYAEAGNSIYALKDNVNAKNKIGVSKTKISELAMKEYGNSKNELYVQFLVRIQKEIPSAKLAIFSTLKYTNAPNFEEFRQNWQAKYLDGFIIPAKSFEFLKGSFPIGFLIWDLVHKQPISTVTTQVYDVTQVKNKSKPENPEFFFADNGEKTFFNLPRNNFLNLWIKRPVPNSEIALPLKNSITPSTISPSVTTWSDNAIGYMRSSANDIQHAGQHTIIFSSLYGDGHGFYVNPENLSKAAVIFSVRQLIKHHWTNHNDQFLQPNCELPMEFYQDCLIWMLFHGKNLSAGADGLGWNDKTWSLTNHFIPFTEAEIGARDRMASNFMADYVKDKEFSREAQWVLNAGRKIFQNFHEKFNNGQFDHKTREEWKLGRADVGWYQIRQALGKNTVEYRDFQTQYAILSDKLRPLVYQYGFLRE